MIKIENAETLGWEHAIRGMRNPMNSWDKSDSDYKNKSSCSDIEYCEDCTCTRCEGEDEVVFAVGPNDLKLMKSLANAGSDDRKFMRMIVVYADITAPMYWWKEFDTYKVGTVRNSCSTMHKIHAKELAINDFSCEHLEGHYLNALEMVIQELNDARNYYNNWEEDLANNKVPYGVCRKDYWEQMIQLLPSSYNQRATVMLNYEVLKNMYHARKNHKLDEWHTFCDWVRTLPYAKELIVSQ